MLAKAAAGLSKVAAQFAVISIACESAISEEEEAEREYESAAAFRADEQAA